MRLSLEGEVLARYPHPIFALPSFSSVRFSPDGSRIYMHGIGEDGSQGVWWIPANGGNATKVVDFDDPSLTALLTLTVGPDHIYLTIAEYESDIWVMDLEW